MVRIAVAMVPFRRIYTLHGRDRTEDGKARVHSFLIVSAGAGGTSAAIRASAAHGFIVTFSPAAAACEAVADAVALAGEQGRPAWIRPGAPARGLPSAEHLAVAVAARPAGIVLPRVAGPEDIERFGARLRVLEARLGLGDGETRIVAVIGTPAAVLAAPRLRPHPRLAALAWAPFRLRGGRAPGGDVRRLSRSLTLLAASQAGVPALAFARDGDDALPGGTLPDDVFRRRCRQALEEGFDAMVAESEAEVRAIHAICGPDAGPLPFEYP